MGWPLFGKIMMASGFGLAIFAVYRFFAGRNRVAEDPFASVLDSSFVLMFEVLPLVLVAGILVYVGFVMTVPGPPKPPRDDDRSS